MGDPGFIVNFPLTPFPVTAQDQSGREERKDEERSKHFSLFFSLKTMQVIYIGKSMGSRFSSKNGQFPFFLFLSSAYGKYPLLGEGGWWFFFLLFMWIQDPALHCLQRAAHWDQWLTGTLTRILAHSSATILSYISSCYKCLGGSSPGLGSVWFLPGMIWEQTFRANSWKVSFTERVKKSLPRYHWHHELSDSL